MRIAYLCADPGIGVFGTKGASVHIQELVRAWRERATAAGRTVASEVEVFAVRRGDEVPTDLADLVVHVEKVARADSGADPVQATAAREQAQREAAGRLAGQVVAGGFDVVHERYSLFSTALAQVREQAPDTVTLLEVNAPLIDEQRTHRVLVDQAGAEQALAAQLRAADVVACVSEPVAQWVRSHCPADADPAVLVTPNGVNTSRIQPVQPDLSGDPVVVFVGTLKPWHGVEHLVRAAALARRPWRLRIVGDGPQRPQLEELAAATGLQVDFVGAVAPEEVPATLQGAMVAVAPYPASVDHYFSPLKVYEYSAAALPVVASRIGEIPQVVCDASTGLMVEPGDPQALARAVDELVADPSRARAMGLAGRELMQRDHSWGSVLAATLAPVAGRLKG